MRHSSSRIPYLPSEIGLAASHAAVELGCAIAGKEFGFSSTRQLAPLLRNAQEGDFVAEGAIYRSLTETTGWKAEGRTVPEAAKATEVLLGLMSEPEGLDNTDRMKLRAFCLGLLNALAASRASALPFEMQMHRMS